MRRSAFLAVVVSVLFVSALSFSMSAAAADATYSGEIMDSQCAKMSAKSHVMVNKDKVVIDPKECTLTCVKNGGKYVLYDATTKTVYQLDDQMKPEKFAGEKVKVTGTLDKDTSTIHLKDINAAP